MLVWKTQTLDINVASLRYRCLLPLRYLGACGVESKVYGSSDTVKLTPQTRALIFVKSFHHVDVATCKRAYEQGVPIILDLCDNIFIEGYGVGSSHIPAENFLQMAQMAIAIVTTGAEMKAEVEAALSSMPGGHPLVVTIPDGSESIEDIEFAARITRKQQWLKRAKGGLKRAERRYKEINRNAQDLLSPKKLRKALQKRKQKPQSIKKRVKKLTKSLRKTYKQGRRQSKVVFYGAKGRAGKVLRQYGLLAPLPESATREPKLPTQPTEDTKSKTLTPAAPTTKIASKAISVDPKDKTQGSQPAPIWPQPWPPAPGLKTVLWFGNHGAKYGNFGMQSILDVADALEAVNKDCPLRLMVVSNNSQKYEAYIAPLPFKTQYLPWHPRKIYDYIRQSDVVIIPNSRSRYSICKSANRAVLTLSQGTPVVASRTPALDLLAGCVWLDDWESGLREYLTKPDIGQAHVKQAQAVINKELSGEAIAQKWIALLNQVAPALGDADLSDADLSDADLSDADAKGKAASRRSQKVLLYLNLPQDLDMLLPIAVRLKEKGEHTVAVAVSDKAWKQSPRIKTLLLAAGIEPQIVSHKAAVAGLQPSLRRTCAVITASESTANAHKGAYTLTQRANQKGIATYTMQHGYENVGITYFDEEYPVGRIMFASQTIFTWVPLEDIPPETPAETRKKCVAVGCPKFIDAPGLKAQVPGREAGSPLVAVFENLHWGRYSDRYRQKFLEDLEDAATAYPNVTFLVKPHHTGLWLTKRYQGTLPAASNLIIADPEEPRWEVFTAPALIEIADAVITTPSTVAIDAVRAEKRVAVIAYDMELPNYAPLPLLRGREDWRSLVSSLSVSGLNSGLNTETASAIAPKTLAFAQTHLVPGDAVQKIIDHVSADVAASLLSR